MESQAVRQKSSKNSCNSQKRGVLSENRIHLSHTSGTNSGYELVGLFITVAGGKRKGPKSNPITKNKKMRSLSHINQSNGINYGFGGFESSIFIMTAAGKRRDLQKMLSFTFRPKRSVLTLRFL